MNLCFPKSEHLCGSIRISELYKSGRRFVVFPLKVTWRIGNVNDNNTPPVQVLVWAPKSLFKRAVQRNRMRRLMREAYRLEKEPLVHYCEEKGMKMEVAFNYMTKEVRDADDIRKAVRKAIEKIIKAETDK